MKKLYTERTWIEANEHRRRKSEARRRSSKARRRRAAIRDYGEPEWTRRVDNLREVTIDVGPELDPMKAENRSLRACWDIRRHVRAGDANIYVDLSQLVRFTLAGVILLSACVKEETGAGRRPIRLRGNVPQDPEVASDFLASGFFDAFRTQGVHLPEPEARWTSARQKKVAAMKAADLVDFAREHVELRPDQQRAMSQNLVECMTNTTNHAATRRGGVDGSATMEEWIAGVRCHDGVAEFAFVDLGVGICRSAKAETYLKQAGQTLGLYGQSKLVERAFDGTLGSSTGSKGRGLGLPRMRRHSEMGLLEALEVCTGKVRGSVERMQFEEVKESFAGTVLTWEASGAE